jgi:lysozyme
MRKWGLFVTVFLLAASGFGSITLARQAAQTGQPAPSGQAGQPAKPGLADQTQPAGEFQSPWNDPAKALVIDFYEENQIDWNLLAADARVAGIIHEATNGYYVDRAYYARKAEAEKRGYKWGSCHVGIPGDPVKQADFYLQFARPAPDELMALDLEDLDPEQSMTLDQAQGFIERIKQRTGRYPMVYGDGMVIREISYRFGKDGIFSETPLWYARFTGAISNFPTGTWNTYTLWQFKSEMNCRRWEMDSCPYLVPGTRADMDVDVYNGTVDELRKNWPFSRAE